MKRNECSFPTVHTETCGVNIATIWDVWADSSYAIPILQSRRDSVKLSPDSGEGKIVIRTHSGRGRVELRGGDVHILEADTLFITDFEDIQSYGSADRNWRFWWFEIYSHCNLHLLEQKVIHCMGSKSDLDEFREIKSDIRRKQTDRVHLATARFIKLLYTWLSRSEEHKEPDRERDRVSCVIDMMHASIAQPLDVEHFALAVGMSTTAFRAMFKRVTGKSPKAYYDHLRLHTAYQLLRQGHYSVAEVARHVGYENQFYFSRVFKKHFGYPPSRA